MTKIIHKAAKVAAVGLFTVASFAMAQDPTPPPPPAPTSSGTTTNTGSTGGWRKVGDPATQSISSSASNDQGAAPATYPQANYPQDTQQSNYPQPQQNYPQPQYPQTQQNYPVQAPPPPQGGGNNGGYNQAPPQGGNYAPQVPAQITVPAGTYITVRVNQLLSSDHNQPGDAFSATLVRPLVANGIVLAEPGQTIGGRVSQAQKAGRVEGLAKLGIELTDLALVDGQQMPIKTTLISRTGNSSVGRDAGAIAGTTGLGAAAGAIADAGRGAAIGAGAGAVVGIVGVLVTRGQPSVIYPEQVLTFKLEQPLTVSTTNSPQAFRYVQPNEYSNQTAYNQGPGYGSYGVPPVGYAVAPPVPYYYSAYGYPYYGYPYYYPYAGFSLFVGPRFGGYYGYRGGYRGFRR
jgi:hypothetical protein